MQEFRIQKAENTDWDQINNIMNTVCEHIVDKASFFSEGWEELLEYSKKHGYTFTAFCGEIMAGFLLVYIPGREEDNLGYDIDLPSEELTRVAHMDVVAVLPQFRGHHIHRKLLEAAEAVIAQDNFKYSMATVYPKNESSLNNFLASGYRIIKTKKKYGGLDRHILWKELSLKEQEVPRVESEVNYYVQNN